MLVKRMCCDCYYSSLPAIILWHFALIIIYDYAVFYSNGWKPGILISPIFKGFPIFMFQYNSGAGHRIVLILPAQTIILQLIPERLKDALGEEELIVLPFHLTFWYLWWVTKTAHHSPKKLSQTHTICSIL